MKCKCGSGLMYDKSIETGKCMFCRDREETMGTIKECEICDDKKDRVNHPSHYNSGKIEVIEAIEDWKLDYHSGNVVKYIARAGKKFAEGMTKEEKELEDLKKALWYLNRRIMLLKGENIKPDEMEEVK